MQKGKIQEAKKDALDRIIVKDNDRMKQIIKWYADNKEYLDTQPFMMPFYQGLVCLQGEAIEFSFEMVSDHDILFKIYLIPDGKSVGMCVFMYDLQSDTIKETRWPNMLPPEKLETLKQAAIIDMTCQKVVMKWYVLMRYAAHYHNEVIVDKKAEKRLDKHSRQTLKKPGHPIPLVRNTYIYEPSEESLKKPVDPEKKRHYEKPDHEVKVRGYIRKNGTRVAPYSRYKDKKDGGPKIYKA